jgi:choline monooxygenase
MRPETMMEPAEIDSTAREINAAHNLTPAMYTSQDVYAAEERAIFAREWVFGCPVDKVAKPGDYVTTTVAGAPIVIVRGADDVIRAFSAVCRHRAALIAQGEGCTKAFRCPYHGWTYGLDGALRAAPLMDKAKDFQRKDYGLVGVLAEVWENFVFINLDPNAAPLRPRLAPLSERLKGYRINEFRHAHRMEYTIRTNWKLYTENSLEEYHIPIVHPNTLQPAQPMNEWISEPPTGGLYDIIVFPRAYYTADNAIEGFPSPPDLTESVATVCLVYPNLLIAPMPDSMMVMEHKPVDVAHTNVRIDFFFRPEAFAHPEFATRQHVYYDAIATILKEDNVILMSTFKGMESRLSRRGRYAFREQIPHRLHNFVLSRLCDHT